MPQPLAILLCVDDTLMLSHSEIRDWMSPYGIWPYTIRRKSWQSHFQKAQIFVFIMADQWLWHRPDEMFKHLGVVFQSTGSWDAPMILTIETVQRVILRFFPTFSFQGKVILPLTYGSQLYLYKDFCFLQAKHSKFIYQILIWSTLL